MHKLNLVLTQYRTIKVTSCDQARFVHVCGLFVWYRVNLKSLNITNDAPIICTNAVVDVSRIADLRSQEEMFPD